MAELVEGKQRPTMGWQYHLLAKLQRPSLPCLEYRMKPNTI
jgi:hypothetical protein